MCVSVHMCAQMFSEIQHIEGALEQEDSHFANAKLRRYLTTLQYFWARGWVASTAWIANDFAFYGKHRDAGILRSSASMQHTHALYGACFYRAMPKSRIVMHAAFAVRLEHATRYHNQLSSMLAPCVYVGLCVFLHGLAQE